MEDDCLRGLFPISEVAPLQAGSMSIVLVCTGSSARNRSISYNLWDLHWTVRRMRVRTKRTFCPPRATCTDRRPHRRTGTHQMCMHPDVYRRDGSCTRGNSGSCRIQARICHSGLQHTQLHTCISPFLRRTGLEWIQLDGNCTENIPCRGGSSRSLVRICRKFPRWSTLDRRIDLYPDHRHGLPSGMVYTSRNQILTFPNSQQDMPST